MAGAYSTRAKVWLYGRLSGDAVLQGQGITGDRIFDALAVTAAPIFIVFQYQGGFDVLPNGRDRLMSSLVFAVKVVGTGNSEAQLEPIVDRVDALLADAAGDTADGYHIESVREAELALPVVVEGDVVTRELGGLYRLLVHRV